jgi:predicted MFS family arabinose efflux permease
MSDAAARRTPLLTRNFAMLLIAQASFGYAFSSFFMLPKFLVTQLSAGPAEVGRVAAAYGVSVIIFIPAMGILVDRFGRRAFMTSGALLMAAVSGSFAWVVEVGPLIYTLRAVQGLAFAMVFVGGATLAVDEAPPERIGQAIALFGLTMLSMNGVAAAGVEAISAAAGWPWAFGAAAAAAALCSLLSRALRGGDAAEHAEEDSSLWQVLVRPSLMPIWIVVAFVGAAMSAMLTYHQPFALALGIANVSGFLVAYASAAIFVRIGLGHFIDRAGRRRVAITALCLYTLVVSATAQLGSSAGLALLGAAFGVAHGFFYPALNSLVIAGVRSSERGKVMALFQGAFNVGFAAAALGFGVLAERAGYPPVFYVGGLCALSALFLLVAFPERRSGTVKEIAGAGEARGSS